MACGFGTFGNLALMLLRTDGYLATICGVVFLGVLVKIGMIWTLVHLYGLPGAAGGAGIANVFESVALMAVAIVTQRLPLGPLFARCWRVAAACAAMAGVLWMAGFAWTGGSEPFAASVIRLTESATLGAATYALTLGGLWLAQGRPDGAEADLIGSLGRVLRRLRRTPAPS